MHRRKRKLNVLPAAAAALALGAVSPAGWADEDEIPFSVAEVFFELNNTDGDSGIHALIDGESWKRLEIFDPRERRVLNIRLQGRLRRQGLTEIFFESAEPNFQDLAPEDFFHRFPQGDYEVEGVSLAGREMESTAEVTHLIPAPPENISVNEVALGDCDEAVPVVSEPVVIGWDPVSQSHPDLGRSGELVTVNRYQVVLERVLPQPLKLTIDLPPGDGVTPFAFELPAELIGSSEVFKFEILVREASGNQTAEEGCFEVL